jgi:hypothetical protein
MSRVPLPEPCKVGEHEPAIVCRGSRGRNAKIANICGRCGREIERQTEKGGPGDPWLTEEQHAEEMRMIREEDNREEYERPEDRCPPRE